MSPLDLIKQGIEKNDWGKVTQGYNQMTGQNLSVVSEGNLVETLEKALSLAREKYTPKHKANTKPPKVAADNQDRTEDDVIKDAIHGDDKIIYPKTRTPRRPPAALPKLECAACHKMIEMIQEQYNLYSGEDQRFTCDDCLPGLKDQLFAQKPAYEG
jgi:hypothetical protein